MSALNELNCRFPVRRSEAQKEEFRNYVAEKVSQRGMLARTEVTSNQKNSNIVIGDPARARAVFTAHYDTPCASVVPNMLIPRNKGLFYAFQFLPLVIIIAVSLGVALLVRYFFGNAVGYENPVTLTAWYLSFLITYYLIYFLGFRTFVNKNNCNDNTSGVAVILSVIEKGDAESLKDAAFILFDNEEKGKKGSKAYFTDHRAEMEKKLVINFDCVGNGENVIFIAMKDAETACEYSAMKESFAPNGRFSTEFYPIKGSESNSDYKNFPCGVGCMACKKTKKGILYTPRIHTPRDTEASDENIEFISSATADLIGRLRRQA